VLISLFLFQAGAGSPAANPLGGIAGFLPIILIFGIFYFLLFLPMQRQRKNTQKMLSTLQTGSVVVTSGGIVGTIVSIEQDLLTLRVKPDNIKLQVTRSAVSSLAPEEGKK
jgi:preprotein translocase subunit YajC